MPSVAFDGPDRHFLLMVVWRFGVPTATELYAVRKLFPEMAMQPPAGLRDRVTADGHWAAGVCPRWRLPELLQEAAALGLTLQATELT